MKLGKRGAYNINKTVEVVLGVFVFTALIGTIATSVISVTSKNGTNVTGGSAVLLGLTTLILVIGFIATIMKNQGLN